MENPPRPPRSLRDRNSALNKQNIDISNTNTSKSFSPSNYLEESENKELEKEIINNSTIVEEEKIISNNKNEKPKVTVLNLRKNTTQELRAKLEEEKENLNNELSASIKKEFKKFEEVIGDAKEEVDKVKRKTIEKISDAGKKVIDFTLDISEKIVDKSKEIIMSTVFKKKINKKVLIKYSDLVEKNIEFFDYQNRSLVKGLDIKSPNYEKVFLSNATKDIKFCERFVKNIKPNTEGIYANRNLSDIFTNIKDKDIYTFIEYINDNPENFIGQKYKLSEAFATWIVRKSHEL